MITLITDRRARQKRTGYPAWVIATALALAFALGAGTVILVALACSDPVNEPSAPYSHSSYRSS